MVRRLAIDKDNIVWVVTSSGVSRISEITISNFDLAIQNEIQVFPNPTSDKISLVVPQKLIGSKFQIFNSVGSLVQNGSIMNDKEIIDLVNVPNGIYFITIDGVYSKKIIVRR